MLARAIGINAAVLGIADAVLFRPLPYDLPHRVFVLHMVVLGRGIPTTSVDEYSATPARWFGVAAHDLPIVLPNIGRFAMPHLGFLE